MPGSIAPQVAAWQRRLRNLPGPAAGGTPNLAGGVGRIVEIWIGYWEDITSFVRYEAMIHITRGRTDESSGVQPQMCTFTVDNRDGRFVPNNPTGPYFGLIGRNTPVRVTTNWFGVPSIRFYGEMAAWPTTWDTSGTDVHAEVEADGVLRRLGQTQLPLKSAMTRSFSLQGVPAGGPLAAYWPGEDAVNSTVIASGLPGGSPMGIFGSPTLGSFSEWPASDSLPVLNGGGFTGIVPDYSGTVQATSGYLEVQCFLQVTSAVASTQRILTMKTSGTAAQWDLLLTTAGDLSLNAYDVNGKLLATVAPTGTWALNNGAWSLVGITLTASGSDIIYNMIVTPLSANTLIGSIINTTTGGTLTSQTFGLAKSVTVGIDRGLNSVTVGHTWVGTLSIGTTPFSLLTLDPPAAAGYAGEGAITRIARLCSEQGLGLVNPAGSTASNALVGPQTLETFLTLLQECLDADTGILYEPADRAGLAIRPLQSLYNQASQLALDYAQNHLSESPTPTDDDRFIQNDVTIERTNGSTVEATLTSGPMSNQNPPNGINSYDAEVELNLAGDGYIGQSPAAAVLTDHAWWRVHVGTTSDSRYPKIAVNVRHLAALGSQITPAMVQGVDVGDRVTIDNPPAWLPPDQISQVVQGYTETIGAFEHDIAFNCSPEVAYRVAVAGVAHADTDGSGLNAGVSATAVALSVATTAAGAPIWTTNAADFPFDIYVAGERMTVTNITGASSPQTFTVTRSVNTVVKAHAAGESVRLWSTPVFAL